MDITNSLMIIDQCHYNLVKIIKEYDYNNPLNILQGQLKETINSNINEIDNTYYNNIHQQLDYILTSFTDNLFLLYGPDLYHNQWRCSTMEKIYFNTVTSGYIFTKQLKKSLESNQEIPLFVLYSYWLFFTSLGEENILNINFKNFFKSMDNKKASKSILPIIYYNSQWVKTTFYHLIIVLGIILVVILGNKYIYLLLINNMIIA